MASIRDSVLIRLALGYALLVIISVGVAATIFYFYTAGLLSHSVDEVLTVQMRRLSQLHDARGTTALCDEIHALLTDDKDVETEEYLVLDSKGIKLIGNLDQWPNQIPFSDAIFESAVVRVGKFSDSRLLSRRLSDGVILTIGRDMQDMRALGSIIRDAVVGGTAAAIIIAVIGAVFFRWQLQRQLGLIHRATLEVGAGNLRSRIEVGDGNDEFAQVALDVNRMLDEIERLLETTRAMANAMAHDLRTPLGRARASLENALRFASPARPLDAAAWQTIDEIDGVIDLFDKLLQISEAEAGVRRRSFQQFSLNGVVSDVVELYEAVCEAAGQHLLYKRSIDPIIFGDRDLVANITANLLDNAIKYAGSGACISVEVLVVNTYARLVVEDNGVGMLPTEIERAQERFFRGDAGRSDLGNGLGLSIVTALVSLHEGRLKIENAAPGFRVVADFPLIN